MPASVAIIGGGPAGLLAAQRLAEAGHAVTIYEAQATVGRKFLVAGHGGFNLSNSEPLPAFTARYGHRDPDFTRYLALFSPQHLRAWLTDLGISTFVGTSGRIFPTPEHKPAQVLRAWLTRLQQLGVRICPRHRWLGFAGAPPVLRLRNEATGHEFSSQPDATILALGGASWAKTGSDGSWAATLTAAGVACVPFAPANCGAEIDWSDFFQEKVGRQPLKNIALRCGTHTVRGELLLTEYGVEGTPVYALTPYLRAALATGSPATLHLHLKPDMPTAQLRQLLARRKPGTTLASFLTSTLHLKGPIPTLLRELLPNAPLPSAPEELLPLLTQLALPIRALRPLDEAISTAGGVAWAALDEHLMLRACPGVFGAGEMLDWEAPTGGYLLQGCFSSGAWAACGVQRWLASH